MPCLQFTKNAASVKHNTVKHNKTRYSCISHYLSISGSIEGKAMKRPAKEEKNKQPAPAVGAQALLSASPALFPGSLSSFPYSTASRPHLRAGDSSSVTGSPCLRKLRRPSSPQGSARQPHPAGIRAECWRHLLAGRSSIAAVHGGSCSCPRCRPGSAVRHGSGT